MSDYDFDHKLRRLEELEAAHPELVTPDSPTQRVGGKVADGFQEVRHRIPLESLQDVFSVEELEEFDQRMQEALPEGVEYDVEPRESEDHPFHPSAPAGGPASPDCAGRGVYA